MPASAYAYNAAAHYAASAYASAAAASAADAWVKIEVHLLIITLRSFFLLSFGISLIQSEALEGRKSL